MGGNIYPTTSPVVSVPGVGQSTNNVAPIGQPANANDWTSFFKPDAGAYGTQYVGPNGQLMTYAIGGDDLATKLQTDAWNKANPNNTIEFDAQASNPYGSFNLSNGLQAATGIANAYVGLKGLELQQDTFAENKAAGRRAFNAQADQYNNEIGRYNAINNSKTNRASQLGSAQSQPYTDRTKIAKV